MDSQLIDLSIAALSKHKKSIDLLNTQYADLTASTELSATEQASEVESIDNKLNKLILDTQSTVKKLISQIEIPVPADGKDFDEKIASALLERQFKDYVLGRDLSIEDIKASITDFAGTLQPKEAMLREVVNGYMSANRKLFQGKPGSHGRDGVDGKTFKSKDGKDGTGVADITITKDSLIVTMTTGEVKEIPLPKKKDKDSVLVGSAVNGRAGYLSKNKDIKLTNPQDGEVLTYSNGKWVNEPLPLVAPGNVDTGRIEIEAAYKFANTTAFKELTYTNGNIVDISIYTTAAKTTKLFTKVIGYNVDNNISSTSITDEVNGATLAKTMSYLDGNISSVASTYTP